MRKCLINKSVGISKLSKITGYSERKLKKAQKTLLEGAELPSLDVLTSRKFCWTLEQVEYLTDRQYLLGMGTRGLIERVADFENKFPD